MAEQQFYQRPNFRHDDERRSVYDDASVSGNSPQHSAGDSTSTLGEVATGEANTSQSSVADSSAASSANDLHNAEQAFTGSTGFRNEGAAPGDSFMKRTGSFIVRRKRGVAIGGGIAGIGIGGVITFSSLLTGPLQTIHLAQLLMKNHDSSNSASENRLNKLFRYARAQDVGDTRVGFVGKKVFGNTIQQLKDVGVEFQRNPRTGNPKSMTIDTSKNPEFKGMTQDQARAAIAEKFGLSESAIVRISNGSSVYGDNFAINTRDIGIKATRALSKNSLTFLEDGKIVSSIRLRVLADYFNTPSLFHPLDRAKASVQNKLATAAERRAAEEERARVLEESTTADAATARAGIKSQLSGVKDIATKALLVTAAMCTVRAVADNVVAVNRAAIVVPSILQAVDKQAVGSQVQYGDGFTSKQFDAVNESFVDSKGQSVFDAKAIRSLDGNQLSGQDLSFDYSQAFSNNTTAANIKDKFGGGNLGAIVCSPAGQIIQAVGGIVLAVSNIVDGGASAAAQVALREGASFIAAAGATSFIEHQATNLLEDKALIPAVFSGPLGGNLMAYGAREAANTDIRAAGGIALSTSEELAYTQQQNQVDKQAFEAKPFFARMFDTHDYRSGISQIADSMSPNTLQNFSKLSSGFANITSLLPSTLANLLPKAHAAEKTYDWGFPKYGIPQSMLDDTTTEDPYDNADKVAALLDSGNGQAYIDKAKTCFGVEISKAGGDWDVKPTNSVNPNSDEYNSADCSNRSDAMWRRVVLFVFDTRTMKAAACYSGDDASCDYSGFGQATTTSSTPSSGSLPSGSAKDLATQLLGYIKSGKISCTGQDSNCPDIQKTATGQSLKGVGSCYVDALDPQILGILLSLVQKGHNFVLSAICSDHPSNATSQHHYGKALDFNIVDGVWLGAGGDIPWDSTKIAAGTKLDQDIASVAPKGSGFGQVQCHPAFSFLQPFVQFNDLCHHQHVQVP